MDIRELLSPDDTPTSTPSPRSTPVNQLSRPPTSAPYSSSSTNHLSPLSQSQTSNNVSSANQMSPPKRPTPSTQRTHSGIDTLADVASMQHSHRSSRTTPTIIRTHDGYEKPPVTRAVRPSLESIARAHSGSRSSLDIHMDEAPMQIPESQAFESSSLEDENLTLVKELTSYLNEHPNAYESHLQLIKILRHGFLSHVYPTEESPQEQDPTTYDLLPQLRQAREAMASRFTMGEQPWVERLEDEMLTARTLEDCLDIVTTFEKAVADETGSTKLWIMFGNWQLALYGAANPNDQDIEQMHDGLNKWISLTENDCLVAREVFGRSQILDVWKRAAEDVKYNINDSHLVWNKYTDLLQLELGTKPSQEPLSSIRQHMLDRLQTPHSAWDETFQRFSTFISTFDAQAYEKTMVQTNRLAAPAKAMFAAREMHEIQLARALESEDMTTAWTILNEYLEWEISQPRKKSGFSFDLANALYQRATLLFPSDTNLWEDHLVLLGEESEHNKEHISTLPLINRACSHCPWSGKLWSLYIQAADRQNFDFADVGQLKHKATSTGLLDSTSMEDILTIYTAWCSFLRRRAFSKEATDEEADVAEVGIRSAIEDMESLGKRKEGKGYQGDPQYRLERIYIKFLAQGRKFDLARVEWKKLIPRQGQYSEFWLRYYQWEMNCWSYEIGKTGMASTQLTPKEATKVLEEAARLASKTDWPEKILETYVVHCQDHETVTAMETAMIVSRRSMKQVAKRREAEATEYAAQQQAQAEAQAQAIAEAAPFTNGHTSKRKREEDDETADPEAKKSKAMDPEEKASQAVSQPKRDRENSTVIVKNLPAGTPENWVQHFFKDCGEIKSIVLSTDEDNGTVIANVEFQTHQDALTALTKDRKSFDDNVIEVSLGAGTVLYVTNFPPEADEAWIRGLFDQYGEIVDIRFPSLKYNTHRRFCYIQYTSSSAAQAATALDDTVVEGDLNLIAKLSDPGKKDQRHGPQHEGREVFVKNLDWRATEEEFEALFKPYGQVERVRIIKNQDGSSKGFGYVVFSSKDEAEASLILNETKFKSRILTVSIAEPKPSKRPAATTSLLSKNDTTKSASPAATSNAASPAASATSPPPPTQSTERAARTIAIFNLPDTINTARLETLLSPHGTIEQITLRPAHQGAIISFTTAASAGKAALAIEGHEIVPGRQINTGPVAELYKHKAEIKDANPGVKKSGKKDHNSSSKTGNAKPLPNTGPIKRPVQAGGRRGGLGQRRGVAAAKGMGQGGTNEDPNTGKSNDEFRRMFVAAGSKENDEQTKSTGSAAGEGGENGDGNEK